MKNNFIIYIIFFFISSCTSIPKNTVNVCNIFSEKYLWYKFAKKTEKKWGAPIELQMAIIKKESGFDWLAKPDRTKIFKVIPWKRPSSSFGYSQAVVGTWDMYKRSTGNTLASRVLFKDSSDFIGWYVDQTYRRLKISKKNYYRQYLAYHEGWKNYKNYNKKSNVVSYAKQVSVQSKRYRSQLNRCKRKLNQKKYIIF